MCGGEGWNCEYGCGYEEVCVGGRGGAVSMGVFLEGFMGMKRCVWGGGGAVSMGVGMKRCVWGGGVEL